MFRSFSQISVRTGLRVTSLCSAVALAALGLLAMRTSADADTTSQELVANVLLTGAAGRLDMFHDTLRGLVYESRVRGADSDEATKNAILGELAETSGAIDKALERLQGTPHDEDVQTAIDRAMPVLTRYRQSANNLVRQALDGSVQADADAAFVADFKALEKLLDQLSDEIADDANILEKRELSASSQHMVWLGGGMLALLALLIGASEFLARHIWRQLGAEPGALKQFALQMASGNLVAELAGHDRSVTTGQQSVADGMLKVRDDLHAAVDQIRGSASIVSLASQEIAQSSTDMCQRIERQSGNLQQSAAAMEQMTGSVTQSAESARQASELVAQTSGVAVRGGESVQRTVQTMAQIQASSRRIAEITGVIDGISFQTNLLALNAAVEAARAGDHGRGFAVVAAEVRSLAQRSATAAQEISALIAESVQNVAAGDRVVQEAGQTMSQIVEGVQRTNELIGHVRLASAEQQTGISEVNGSVSELDRDTQQNAALVTQASAAALRLRDEAGRLTAAVATFRL
ncbi:methyl-accepting chemotaxis protein [Ideonella sp.]|uniref:methyl-accepting chemotaxis protein n=1 Tax=Ideonella sp. TaxID=1929293 RepID=UPI0035B0994C